MKLVFVERLKTGVGGEYHCSCAQRVGADGANAKCVELRVDNGAARAHCISARARGGGEDEPVCAVGANGRTVAKQIEACDFAVGAS